MGKLMTLLALGLIASQAWGAPLTLKELQAKLRNRSSSWVAGENSVTRLTPAERRMMLGANVGVDLQTHFINRSPSIVRGLPSTLDWRNVNGVDYASPILNQGRCGSCVAFATIGTLETQTNITRNTPDSPWAFSPQYLFSCGGGGCESGWTPDQAVQFLQSTGVPDESCFPYAAGAVGDDIACSGACSDAASRSLKITGSSTPTTSMADVNAVKAALQKGPLVTVMLVYEDFFFYKSGVYKHTAGDLQGGHALSIVGYSDADRAWIVRNSWGDDWGDHGFFKISWDDDSGLAQETWGVEVPSADGYVTLGSLRDKTVLSGTVSLEAQSTFTGTHAIDLGVTGNGTTVWMPLSPVHATSLDTTRIPDGVYTLVARAQHASGTGSSEPRVVYVLNGKLSGSLSFTNVTAGQSIAAKSFVMEMQTQSSPVPFERVVFHAKHVASGQEFTKVTTNVAPKLALSWRMEVPAGDYDLWLEGIDGSQSVRSATVRVNVAGK